MNLIEGADRREVLFFPECLDDYIPQNSPVRFIDAFVDSLDLTECGFPFPKQDINGRGRPAYHPADLLKLFIYGYKNGLRSGRKLEKSCQINLEVIWLLKKLAPDFKTICDFRKDNRNAFKKVSSEFTLFCRELNLITGKVVAVDGTTIKASNNISKSWSPSKLDKELKKNEESIEKYLSDIEKLDDDPAPDAEDRKEVLQNKVERAKVRKDKFSEMKTALDETENDHFSLTDPDSRTIKKNGKSCVGYNVQTAVDGEHKLIVCCEVTDKGNDLELLASMAKLAKKELELVDKCDLLTDAGYYSLIDIKECEDMKMIPYLPTVNKSPKQRQGFFGKRAFVYNRQKNIYTCPNKEALIKIRTTQQRDKVYYQYANKKACENCPIKSKCTDKKMRIVSRWEHEEYQERATERINKNPGKMGERKEIVEHPYGTIKTQIIVNGFLVRGKEMVQAEASLAHFAYNLKRVLNIVSFDKLISAVAARVKQKKNLTLSTDTGASKRSFGSLIHLEYQIHRFFSLIKIKSNSKGLPSRFFIRIKAKAKFTEVPIVA